MQEVKKSTANQVVFCYLVDATDGYSPELEAAIITAGPTYPTCYLSKNGGTPGSLTLSASNFVVLSDANMPGWFKLVLSASDTDTLGPLGIDVYKSTVSRHYATVVQVKDATTDEIKTDTAAILDDTGTSGVVVPAATQAAIVDAILDEVNTAGTHAVTNSVGVQLRSATAAADPWSVDLPGSYVAGQAGYEIARAISGAGAGVGTITVQDEDDAALATVRVDIYTSTTVSAATFWTGGYTNSSGVFTFYAPTGTYYARRYKQGYSFTSDPVTVTVS